MFVVTLLNLVISRSGTGLADSVAGRLELVARRGWDTTV